VGILREPIELGWHLVSHFEYSFRPVRCSLAGVERTVLFAYGFDTTATQAAWVGEWGNLSDQRGAMLVESGTWAVEVLDPDIAREVRSIFLSSA
jgi:hypothetical protein